MSDKPTELLVTLSVDDKTSKKNINEYIEKFKSQDLGITLNINDSKKVNKQLENIQKGLDSLVNKSKETEKALNRVGSSDLNNKAGRTFIDVGKNLEQVQAQIENFLRNNGFQNFEYQINSYVKGGQRILQDFVATIKDVNGEVNKLRFVPNDKGSFTEVTDKLNVTKIADFNKYLIEVDKELGKISRSGKLSSEEIEKFQLKIAEIKNSDIPLDKKFYRIREELTGLRTAVDDVNLARKFEEANNKVKDLESYLNKTINTYKRVTKNEDLTPYKKEISDLYKELERFKRENGVSKFFTFYDAEQFARKIDRAKTSLKEFNAKVTEANRSSLTFVDQLKVAFERFPIWMTASTAFFSTIRTAKEFVNIIIDVDTKLTNISKVLSEDMNLSEVFERAEESAKRFGKTVSDTLDAYTEFARQGYKGNELGILSDAALVASNVGEISTQKAAEYLTSTLVQWQLESKSAMKIIDSWNAISNKYATTVEKLAAGQTKAGATAKAVGLELDELNAIIGALTVRTKQSGDEIGNFLKNTLVRLTSAPSQNALEKLGVSLADEKGNMRNVVEIYTEVANKLKTISGIEKNIIIDGLAGKQHANRLQSLLDDLGSANSLYRQIYETSKNSAGSAMQENEKYMDSLQAKINLMKVEFEELALAIGEALLSDGMIAFFGIVKDGLNFFTNFVNAWGVLPSVMSGGIASLVLFSSRFRGLIDAVKKSSSIFMEATKEQRSLRAGIDAVSNAAETGDKSAKKLANAWGAVKSAFIGGAVFAVVGFALEKLISAMGEARRKAEDLKEQHEQMLSTYKENENQIDDLVVKYDKLSETMKARGLTTDEYKEYRDVQNEIASLLPQLATGEDQYGNKISASAELINTKVQALKEELEIQRQLNDEQQRKDLQESIELNLKEIEKAKTKTEDWLEMLVNGLEGVTYKDLSPEFKINFRDNNGQPLLKSIEDVDKAIDELQTKLADAESKGSTRDVELLNLMISNMQRYKKMLADEQIQIIQSTAKLKSEYVDLANELINKNDDIANSMKETASSFASDLIKMADSSNIESLKTALENIFGGNNSDAVKIFDDVISKFDELGKATDETFNEVYKNVEDTLKELPFLLKDYLNTEQIASVTDVLNQRLKNTKKFVDQNRESIKQNSKTIDEAMASSQAAAGATGDYTGSLDENSDSANKNMQVHERLAGVTESQVSKINELIFTYEMLSKQEALTAEQEKLLNQTKEQLLKLYPHILSYENGTINISKQKLQAMKNENEANQILIEAYKLAAQGKLNAEQQATLAQASATKARIDNIRKEVQALQLLQDAAQAVASAIGRMTSKIAGNLAGLGVYVATLTTIKASGVNLSSKISQLNKLGSSLNTSVKGLKNIGGSSGNSNKGSKNSKDSSKKDVYYTDKYKQNLEKINSQIAQQEAKREKLNKTSKDYLSSLKKQKVYEEDKLKLMQNQANSLSKQIKNGKIWTTSGWKKDKKTIDDAKSELKSLNAEIANQKNAVKEMYEEIANYNKNVFDSKNNSLQNKINSSKTAMEGLAQTSSKYSKELNNQKSYIKDMIKLNTDRQNQIEKDLNNKNLSGAYKSALREELKELKLNAKELNNELKNIENTFSNISQIKFEKKMNTYNTTLERSKILTEMMEEGSKEYNKELKTQANVYKNMIEYSKKRQASINGEIKLNKVSAERLEELKEEYEDLTTAILDYQKSLYDLSEALKGSIQTNIEQLKDSHIKSIEDKIDSTKKKYDDLIEKQREQLKLLDEEIEKEDRLKQLQEINQKIEDALKDKRYSYITAEGKEILTYDKGKVQELQKERDELLKEWEREDAKKAIENEIDRLEEERDKLIDQYEKQIETEEKHWDDLLESVKNGTVKLDTYLTDWYKNNKKSLGDYANEVSSIISKIKNDYSTLGSIISTSEKADSISKINVDVISTKNISSKKLKEEIDKLISSLNKIKPYHDGGIVEGSTNKLSVLFNKAFNLKPNEVITKQLVGELNIPPKNIPNIAETIEKVASAVASNNTPTVIPTGDDFIIQNMIVQANNMNEWLKSVQMITRMKQ